jgi:hypothetical protein
MKSHKRQWIERWFDMDRNDPQFRRIDFDVAEQELLEAIEKDNPEQFSREEAINFANWIRRNDAGYTAGNGREYANDELLTEYLNSPEYLKAKS